MLKIKQYFCRHDYKLIARHNNSQLNLWQCNKCKVFYIQHYGLYLGYKCKIPNILTGWDNYGNGSKIK
jgi:hypothetical protein